MTVGHIEQFLASGSEPFVTGVGLALWTVPVATRVKGDGAVATSGAALEMTAERCRTAVFNGMQHLQMLPGQMLPVAFNEAFARGTDDIGHLQGGPVPLFLFSRDRLVS